MESGSSEMNHAMGTLNTPPCFTLNFWLSGIYVLFYVALMTNRDRSLFKLLATSNYDSMDTFFNCPSILMLHITPIFYLARDFFSYVYGYYLPPNPKNPPLSFSSYFYIYWSVTCLINSFVVAK